MIRRTAVAVVAAAALAGCPWHPREPQPQTIEGEWGIARDAATRRGILYDGLQHRATATVTHLSLAVREARARRLAKWLDWSPQQLEGKLAEERAAAAAAEEFIVSFYAADPRANDLDAPKSTWNIGAKIDGADLVATHVTSIEMDMTLLGLFPYVGHFDTAYLVTCPRMATGDLAGRPFKLDFASALGRLTVDWALPDGSLSQKPVQPAP
jgi:hypothetical protein